jgi:Domain of unknown function (DUF4430)
MKHRSTAGLAGLVLALLLAAPAVAAGPATVKLRVEGATTTIYEGVVTTDARSITMSPGPMFGGTYPGGTHMCSGMNGTNDGGYTSPGGSPTTALDDAAKTGAFTWYGPFDSTFDDFFVTTIGGEGTIDGPYWDVRTNGVSNSRGGCQIELANGDEVLYAIDGYPKPALKLTGPATAAPGMPFTVRVTDETGAVVDGAAVGGQTTTGGAATVRLDSAGPQRLKATKDGSIRSNGLDVCVTNGSDGACGTVQPSAPDTTAPTASILGIRDGRRFTRRRAPRELSGTVSSDPSGLWAVKIRLTRRFRGTCWYFSGSREQFLKRTCGKQYAFKVGDRSDWSYLLPARLPRGRYVLDTYAIDNAFNRGEESRVVFRVR